MKKPRVRMMMIRPRSCGRLPGSCLVTFSLPPSSRHWESSGEERGFALWPFCFPDVWFGATYVVSLLLNFFIHIVVVVG